MSGSIDELKKQALLVADAQDQLTKDFSNFAGELEKDANKIEGVLGSHNTRDRVVAAIRTASQAVKSAAESCNKSATASREYVALHFGGQ